MTRAVAIHELRSPQKIAQKEPNRRCGPRPGIAPSIQCLTDFFLNRSILTSTSNSSLSSTIFRQAKEKSFDGYLNLFILISIHLRPKKLSGSAAQPRNSAAHLIRQNRFPNKPVCVAAHAATQRSKNLSQFGSIFRSLGIGPLGTSMKKSVGSKPSPLLLALKIIATVRTDVRTNADCTIVNLPLGSIRSTGLLNVYR